MHSLCVNKTTEQTPNQPKNSKEKREKKKRQNEMKNVRRKCENDEIARLLAFAKSFAHLHIMELNYKRINEQGIQTI